MSEYRTVIGLEIHAELLTKTKIFCNCSAEFGGAPNTRVCPVCTGMPGTLPIINQTAVEYAVKAGYALFLTERTIFTPTCPRLIRYHSSITR